MILNAISIVSMRLLGVLLLLAACCCPCLSLRCYNYTEDSGSEPDSVLVVCPAGLVCMAIVRVEVLEKYNPSLKNITNTADWGTKSKVGKEEPKLLVTRDSIYHQMCFTTQLYKCSNPYSACQRINNSKLELALCCCDHGLDGCNRASNIVIYASQLKIPAKPKDAEGGSGDRTEGGRGLGHLGLVLLVTLVPATLIGVVAVLTFLFTSCKYTKLIHLLRGTSDQLNSTNSNRGCMLASGDANRDKGEANMYHEGATCHLTREAAGSSGTGTDGNAMGLLNENQKFLRSLDLSECPLIGQGKFGSVYKLQHSFMGEKQVAVKVFYVSDRASWQKEVDIFSLAEVQHHLGVLRFLAADDRGVDGCWLVTQYHPRGSLYDYLSSHHAISPQAIIRVAESFFGGLAFLHDGMSGGVRVAHRDIKSRNMLLKEDFTCCICDFGLAMQLRPDQEIGYTHSQVGTRRYMAPEVLEGAIIFTAEAFLRIDVYAAALVLWELLSCTNILEKRLYRVPFEAELGPSPTAEQINVFVAERRLRPTIPPQCIQHPMLSVVCETVEECWDQDCEARLSAVCVQQRLHRLIQSLSSSSSPHSPSFNSPQQRLPADTLHPTELPPPPLTFPQQQQQQSTQEHGAQAELQTPTEHHVQMLHPHNIHASCV
ncbi:activin receptor type-1-like isoform X2 [Symsagittifera roscoffensis]|uniref:activin receptor type-1-like isoform X2 n=1 Tax=Symsagittifera roscoffensis TaxID=84072 RepID=UPI00307B6F0D